MVPATNTPITGRVYAECGRGIFDLHPWLPLIEDPQSENLWVDCFALHSFPDLLQYLQNHPDIKRVFFHDLYHAFPAGIYEEIRNIIRQTQNAYPGLLLTTSMTKIRGIRSLSYDWLWNRCKGAFWDRKLGWKQSLIENYKQWPIHTERRPGAVMSMYRNATRNNLKQRLYDAIKHIPGYHSNFSAGIRLEPDHDIDALQFNEKWAATPPARRYFDHTYVSVQVESCFLGDQITFSEKTYDFLIQGRFVYNFGPQFYYRTLAESGWALPSIDLSWDEVPDNVPGLYAETRFAEYIKFLQRLLRNRDKLHRLFIDNLSVFQHNQRMLKTKPYQYVTAQDLGINNC